MFVGVVALRYQHAMSHKSMQANKGIHLWQRKAPICKLSHNKVPKTQLVKHWQHHKKTSDFFSRLPARVLC